MFYPPQEIYLYMSKGPFEHLNIYLQYGLRKLGFKNTILHRPLFDPKNFYHGWMVDGWNHFSSFFFFILLWYIAHVQIYILNYITLCKTKVLWVLKFGQVGELALEFRNYHLQGIFFLTYKVCFCIGNRRLGKFFVIFERIK